VGESAGVSEGDLAVSVAVGVVVVLGVTDVVGQGDRCPRRVAVVGAPGPRAQVSLVVRGTEGLASRRNRRVRVAVALRLGWIFDRVSIVSESSLASAVLDEATVCQDTPNDPRSSADLKHEPAAGSRSGRTGLSANRHRAVRRSRRHGAHMPETPGALQQSGHSVKMRSRPTAPFLPLDRRASAQQLT
jgi:hypothetical protein